MQDYNIIIDILDTLEQNGYITKEQREEERLMLESYKRDNDIVGFWNNEGYDKKYDCCFRDILRLFGVIVED